MALTFSWKENMFYSFSVVNDSEHTWIIGCLPVLHSFFAGVLCQVIIFVRGPFCTKQADHWKKGNTKEKAAKQTNREMTELQPTSLAI